MKRPPPSRDWNALTKRTLIKGGAVLGLVGAAAWLLGRQRPEQQPAPQRRRPLPRIADNRKKITVIFDEQGLAVMGAKYDPALPESRRQQELTNGAGLDAIANEPMWPASMTKMMTALTVYEAVERADSGLTMASIVDVPESAVGLAPSRRINRGAVRLRAGEKLTVREALHLLIIHSDNTIAHALAIRVAGSIPGFTRLMNQTARRIGMTNTNYTNPHGLHHERNLTTAADQNKLMRHLTAHAVLWRMFSLRTATIQVSGRQRPNLIQGSQGGWIGVRPLNEAFEINGEGAKTGLLAASGATIGMMFTLRRRNNRQALGRFNLVYFGGDDVQDRTARVTARLIRLAEHVTRRRRGTSLDKDGSQAGRPTRRATLFPFLTARA